MKKLIVLMAAVVSAAVVQAGDWTFDSTNTAAGITDGTWTFGVSINKTKRTVSIDRVKVAPQTVTALDFSKPVRDENGDEWTISTLNCGFVDNNASPVNYVARAGFAEFVGELTLPGEGLTTIANFALGSCKNMTGTLKFPSTLTSVGRMAFQDDTGVTIYAEDFPLSIKTLNSDSTFKNVNIIGDLDLTALEGTLASSVFQGCKNLTSVKFGPGLTKLEGGSNQSGAFSGCSSLTNVVFDPASSFYLGVGAAFAHCTSLTEMDLSSVTTIWCPNSDTNKDNSNYTIFLNCTSLAKVVFSSKLTKMHHLAFYGCSSLAEIVFQGMPPEFGWEGYPLFKGAASGKTLVSTVMLDSNDPDYAAQKAAWDALTEEGELTATSHWRQDMIGTLDPTTRPLVMHVVQTATVTAGEDADRVTGQPGSFVFSRGDGDATTAPLMVRYAVSGTAESGKSYAPLFGTFMIPSGAVSATMDVTPLYDSGMTEDATIVLTITESGDYTIGDPGSAEIKVTSDRRFVKIEAAGDADETKGTDGAFVVSRKAGDPLDAAITVNYTIGGTAVPGRTYMALSGSVTIPSSEQSARIAVTPLYDPETTEDTTVVLTLADGEYDIGSPASAEIKVLNGVRHLFVTAGGDANMGTGAVGTFVIALGEGEATAADLTINYTVGGTAQAGQAYAALSGTATIKAGASSVIVQVIPLNDTLGTDDTSVSVSIAAGDYTIVTGEAALSVIHADSFGGWLFANSKITDGTWTFSASADKNRKMTVGKVAAPSPGVLSPLEFAKAVLDADNQPYQIVTLSCGFVDNSHSYIPLEGFAEYVGSLTLPEGLVTLSDYSLGQCKNMTGVVKLPSTLTTIGRMALQNAKITIYAKDFPKGLKTFTNGSAFENVDIVGDLDLSAVEGVVPSGSFNGCTNITSVKFGPGLTAIEGGYAGGAFGGCSSLTNVVIDPAANVRFGPGAVFAKCTGLTEIDLSCCVNIYPHNDVSHTNMAEYATFYGCSNLRKVTFGPKVRFLHNMALYSGTALAEVHFTGAPPEIVGVPYMKNPTKKVNNQTVYPTITTYISKKNLTLKNKAGKCWLDYAADGTIGLKRSTFAAEYVQYGTYQPDPSARPLLIWEQPGLKLIIR